MASAFPTPPGSFEIENDVNQVHVSMSTTFYPREMDPSDFMIISSDRVFFAVHKQVLLQRSVNRFGNLLGPSEDSLSCSVEEHSSVMNLILHAFYDYDPTNYRPTLDQLANMLIGLNTYGLPVTGPVAPGKPLYNLLLSTALSFPLDTFALVCQHHLESLAVEISHHLISIPLHNLSDEQCLSMGPVYLRRLVFLHLGRTERLKKLLKGPPEGHPPTKQCDTFNQKRELKDAWEDAAGTLAWEANANTPVSLLHSTFLSIADRLTCSDCRTSAKERIRKLIVDWTNVKTTI